MEAAGYLVFGPQALQILAVIITESLLTAVLALATCETILWPFRCDCLTFIYTGFGFNDLFTLQMHML